MSDLEGVLSDENDKRYGRLRIYKERWGFLRVLKYCIDTSLLSSHTRIPCSSTRRFSTSIDLESA